MNFLGNAFDFFLLFFLTAVLCIPVVTAGAAMTAQQYVGMKIMRKEAPAVLASYFKAFKENFKQATLLWLIQLVILVVAFFDWSFVLQIGWGNIPMIYRAFLILMTVLILFVNLSMYAVIARFEMRGRDVMKTTLVLVMTNLHFLVLILIMIGVTVFGCIWFFSWLPAIFVVGATGTTAFHAFVMKRACEKLEAKFDQNDSGQEE